MRYDEFTNESSDEEQFKRMMNKIIAGSKPTIVSRIAAIPTKITTLSAKRYYRSQITKYKTLADTALHDAQNSLDMDPRKQEYGMQYSRYKKFQRYFEMMLGTIEYDSIFVKTMRDTHPWLKRIAPIQESSQFSS